MYKFIFILLFLPIVSLLAKNRFAWVQKIPQKWNTGFCIEVDERLSLENYQAKALHRYSVKVQDKKCRPKKVSYYYSVEDQKCYETDLETGGENYFKSISDLEKCKTMPTTFIVQNQQCLEIDSKTRGTLYYKKVDWPRCLDSKLRYTWVRRSETKGTCYQLNEHGRDKLKVLETICKPEKSIFVFTRTSPLDGYCIEKSAVHDNDYSRKVSNFYCKPKATTFFFYKKPGKKSGQCYEVDTKTRGDLYLNKVKALECK